ncbi:uncharacterized protein LOC113258025 [Ursus arctos]|uniref:uncharacterized protein LOC113258025 n=1 Tax=Ursus arctos TaxID=9644 RepID=UPI000E6DF51D|nr:uncharacterized protein LOC113258025 [Ursus arctos]
MFIVMIGSSEITDRNWEWDISRKNIEDIMEVLQFADQLSTDNVLQALKLLKVKILNNKMATPLCQKVTDIIVDYLRTMKPEGELEELCTAVLMALGFQSPGIVIFKLWDRWHNNLPPNCLLIAVGRLIHCQGAASYIGVTWAYTLRLLRMAQTEEDMLAICHVLKGLAISARKHLDLGTSDDEIMDITQEAVSFKAYLTLRLLFNRWSLKSNNKVTEQALVIIGHLFFLMPPSKLKNQVNRLTRWLMTLISAKVTPFYISQCICQLMDALALSGCGGINLESQLENIIGILFNQLNETVEVSDPHSARNHSLALKAFYILTKLYNDQVVFLIRKNMQTSDPAKIVSALQVFMDVFQEVPQTQQLKNEVMHSVIIMIQEDLKPVRKALLNFIEMLSQHDYLAMPQGNVIINYVIKLSESDCSNEEDIQLMCSKILQMVSLPKLITLACQPSNTLAFVSLSRTATNMALKARSLGQFPYLSSFHLSPTQFVSPQKLLTHLVFSGQSLVAINDDSWLEQLIKVVLERINYFSDGEEKTFLYKFFGFTLRTSRNMKLVKMMLLSILQSVHEDLQERQGIAVALSIVSMKHLKIVLDQLQVYSAILTDKGSSFILKLMKEHQQREWGLVCNIIYLSYSKIILESKGDIFTHLDDILAMVLQHYRNCIVEKDKNLKLEYLDALTKLTNILSSHPMAFQFKFPQKLEIVTFMVELIREEPLNSISSSIRLRAMNVITDFRKLRPLIEVEERTELLRTCYKSVLCLPPIEVLQKEASSSQEAHTTVDLFRETLQSLLRLMETLIVEMPSRIQHCLEERDQVKISATSALGYMLRQVDKFKPGLSTRREIYTFLVPLLLSIQDNNTEVVKACGGALTEWTNVIGWSSLTQTFRHTTLSDHIQVLEETCRYLVSTSKTQLVGDLLCQSFGFLKSPQSFLRAAAINFIGLTAKKLSMSQIHEDDVELLQNAIGSLRNDPVESIQSLVNTTLKKIDEYVNPGSVSTSRMSQLSNNIFKVTGMKTPKRKKRLFKSIKRERDDGDNQKKKIWKWLQRPLNSLRNRYNRRVKNIPLIIGNSDKSSVLSQVPTFESPPAEAGPTAK